MGGHSSCLPLRQTAWVPASGHNASLAFASCHALHAVGALGPAQGAIQVTSSKECQILCPCWDRTATRNSLLGPSTGIPKCRLTTVILHGGGGGDLFLLQEGDDEVKPRVKTPFGEYPQQKCLLEARFLVPLPVVGKLREDTLDHYDSVLGSVSLFHCLRPCLGTGQRRKPEGEVTKACLIWYFD